jgi:NAD(P)-dependent dehydrogenase (short-subunit alcohol dehydrogenase family)
MAAEAGDRPGAGRVAVVTGASRGIGQALAVRLARDGWHVVLAARDEQALIATDDLIHAAGGTATIAPLDLRDFAAIDRLADAVAARWGGIDLLVVNAAQFVAPAPLAHIDPAEFEQAVLLNIVGSWRLLRAFDPLLRRSHGTVAAFSSSVTNKYKPYWSAYSASKAALEMLAGIYAGEMQALGVNALIVDPGGTRTTMRARAFPGEDPETLKTPDVVADAVADALGRMGPGAWRLTIDNGGSSRFAAEPASRA